MNVFATLLSVLALASLAYSAGLPVEDEFDSESNELDYVAPEVLTYEQTLEAMGIDARFIDPSIYEDANLLVVRLIPIVNTFLNSVLNNMLLSI